MNSENLYVSLDVGTSSVRAIIGDMSGGALKIIGVGRAPSIGMRKGAIVDIDETVKAIKEAVDQAERMVDLEVKQVIVGINGNQVEMRACNGIVAVSSTDREIQDEDVERVIDAAHVMSIPPDREIIDIIPAQFIVDGMDGIKDPRGMLGTRLEMEGTIITGAKTALHNLLRCVERAGLEIADIVLQPLASGSVAVSKDERSLGVALIDIGGGSTTVSVFQEGQLQTMSFLPIGGSHISNDISVGIRTTAEEAERLKLEHGHAFIDDASDDLSFSIQTLGNNDQKKFTQLELAEIIEPRMEEILTLVQQEINRMGYHDLPGGYVLTGGAVMMPGTLELAQDIWKQHVRLAMPDYIGVREPTYTASIGLIEFAYKSMKVHSGEESVVAAGRSEKYADSDRPASAGEANYRNGSSTRQQNRTKEKDPEEPGFKERMRSVFKSFFE